MSNSNINNVSSALSGAYVSTSVSTGREQKSVPTEEPEIKEFGQKLTKEEADKFAENLKNALNTLASTRVSFDVSVQDKENGVSFKVIDTDSGEVIRQFPQESILSNDTNSKSSGLIIKKIA